MTVQKPLWHKPRELGHRNVTTATAGTRADPPSARARSEQVKAMTEEQIAVLGLDEMAGYENSLVLVEWGDRFESVAKMAGGEIYMEHGEGDERGMLVRVKD